MALIVVGSTNWLAAALLVLAPAALLGDAMRLRARRRPAPVAPSDVEVERLVRDRLYGERTIEILRDS